MINCRTYLGISMTRRRNRRWLVASYWASVVVILGSASLAIHQGEISPTHWWTMLLAGGLFGTMIVFLGGAGQIGPIADFDGDVTPSPRWVPLEIANALMSRLTGQGSERRLDSSIDERDIRLRNAAHFEAYRLLRTVLMPIAIASVFIFQFVLAGDRYLSIPVYCLLILLINNLPQTLILWWEPDIEEL